MIMRNGSDNKLKNISKYFMGISGFLVFIFLGLLIIIPKFLGVWTIYGFLISGVLFLFNTTLFALSMDLKRNESSLYQLSSIVGGIYFMSWVITMVLCIIESPIKLIFFGAFCGIFLVSIVTRVFRYYIKKEGEGIQVTGFLAFSLIMFFLTIKFCFFIADVTYIQ